MHKRKTFIIIAVLAALILTGGSSYYLGTKSQQSRPETVVAEVIEPEPVENFPTAREDPVSADRIFELVNAERVKVGLQPLVRDARLDASAKAKCDDMVARDYLGHADPDGNMAWHYFTENGYSYSNAGENLANRHVTSSKTVYDWMNSPTHKDNIVSSTFRDTGVAVCGYASFTTVQHFAKPL